MCKPAHTHPTITRHLPTHSSGKSSQRSTSSSSAQLTPDSYRAAPTRSPQSPAPFRHAVCSHRPNPPPAITLIATRATMRRITTRMMIQHMHLRERRWCLLAATSSVTAAAWWLFAFSMLVWMLSMWSPCSTTRALRSSKISCSSRTDCAMPPIPTSRSAMIISLVATARSSPSLAMSCCCICSCCCPAAPASRGCSTSTDCSGATTSALGAGGAGGSLAAVAASTFFWKSRSVAFSCSPRLASAPYSADPSGVPDSASRIFAVVARAFLRT
mmetsp:Transcript_6621/g.15452  ORF Transcript_6621/g.15452 Transcript_6621/m.15452 type:complete len:272 (+) Transcript_6621:265-1080(+)